MSREAMADAGTAPSSIRVVDCDANVPSRKRGVGENHLDAADFRALAPGVSWYYNWHFETTEFPPSDLSMEYIPMAWGDRQEALDGLNGYLQDAAIKPRVVLAINEPNLKGQSFITPESTAEFYNKVQAVAGKYGIGVVGPNMCLGSPPENSIKAMDPIENKQVVYTFMIPFLKAFYFFLGQLPALAESPPVGLHTYGSIGEMKWAVEETHRQFKGPIWVTEFAYWDALDAEDERDYLIQATDYLERTPYVQGYAWFKERIADAKISLLEKEPGKLTPLGQTYVALPTHDADLYYRIPGKLSAGKYVSIDQMDILSNSRNRLLVTSHVANATADYNIEVASAGNYELTLSALGTGKIEVLGKDQVLGSVEASGAGVQSLGVTVALPAGAQTLRVRFDAAGIVMSRIEFSNR